MIVYSRYFFDRLWYFYFRRLSMNTLKTKSVFWLTIDRAMSLRALFSVIDEYPRAIDRVFRDQRQWRGDAYEIRVEICSFTETIVGTNAVYEALRQVSLARPNSRSPNTFELLTLNFARRKFDLRGTIISKVLSLGASPTLMYERAGRIRTERVVSLTEGFAGHSVSPTEQFVTIEKSALDLDIYEKIIGDLQPIQYIRSV